MVQTTTTLDVADNSGAKKLMCIRVLGGTRRKYASIGDVIVVSIKEGMFNNANVVFRTKFVDGVSTVARTTTKHNTSTKRAKK